MWFVGHSIHYKSRLQMVFSLIFGATLLYTSHTYIFTSWLQHSSQWETAVLLLVLNEDQTHSISIHRREVALYSCKITPLLFARPWTAIQSGLNRHYEQADGRGGSCLHTVLSLLIPGTEHTITLILGHMLWFSNQFA